MEGKSSGTRCVKDHLESFISAHIPGSDLSCVDDIVLAYVVDVLSDLGDDNSFDVEQFIQMMAAYIPGFAAVDSAVVCEWIIGLASINNNSNNGNGQCGQQLRGNELECDAVHKSSAIEVFSDYSQLHAHSEAKDAAAESECEQKSGKEEGSIEMTSELRFLQEMFSDVSLKEIRQQLKKSHNNVEQCVHVLLQAQDKGTRCLKQKSSMEKSIPLTAQDPSIKDDLLKRYEFVDTNDDKVQHRPLLPKEEGKKMIRYRDGKVVSVKGEKYTLETKPSDKDDEMKKTYVNLKPLRKYRFH